MKPIVIFYHCLFERQNELLPSALEIVHDQMDALQQCGLLDMAAEFIVGVNGGPESRVYVESLIPERARVIYHGLQCQNECRTITAIEDWVAQNGEASLLYFHTKGATHHNGARERDLPTRWRRCMMKACVYRWQECVVGLERGYDAIGAHWMEGQGDDFSQNYFAGTFFWATTRFLRTLPSLRDTARVKLSGLDSPESRYESEVWIGNGPRLPRVMDLAGHRLLRCP